MIETEIDYKNLKGNDIKQLNHFLKMLNEVELVDIYKTVDNLANYNFEDSINDEDLKTLIKETISELDAGCETIAMAIGNARCAYSK